MPAPARDTVPAAAAAAEQEAAVALLAAQLSKLNRVQQKLSDVARDFALTPRTRKAETVSRIGLKVSCLLSPVATAVEPAAESPKPKSEHPMAPPQKMSSPWKDTYDSARRRWQEEKIRLELKVKLLQRELEQERSPEKKSPVQVKYLLHREQQLDQERSPAKNWMPDTPAHSRPVRAAEEEEGTREVEAAKLPVTNGTRAEEGSCIISSTAIPPVLEADPATFQCLLIGTHNGVVLAMLISGNRLFTAGSDKIVKVWDTDTSDLIATLEGHTGAVTCLTEAEGVVYSGSRDGNIMAWSLKSFMTLRTFEGHRSVLALATVGSRLFSGGEERAVRAWDLATKDEDSSAAVGYAECGVLSMVAFGSRKLSTKLATGCSDTTVSVWDPASLELLARLCGHTGPVMSLAAFGDELYSGSYGGEVRVWDTATPDDVATIRTIGKPVGHQGEVTCLTAADRRLASGSIDDGKMRIWNTETYRYNLIATVDGGGCGVAARGGGQAFFSGSVTGAVSAWRACVV